ncbi:MAG: hypothetical protein V1659_03025 [Candidatus Woesearchaeota archaeon]
MRKMLKTPLPAIIFLVSISFALSYNTGDCIEQNSGYADYNVYTSCIAQYGWDAYADCAFLFAADVRSPDPQSANDLSPSCYLNPGDQPLLGGSDPRQECSWPGVFCDADLCDRMRSVLYNLPAFDISGDFGCFFSTGSGDPDSGCTNSCDRVHNDWCLQTVTGASYDDYCPSGTECAEERGECFSDVQCCQEPEILYCDGLDVTDGKIFAVTPGHCCPKGETWNEMLGICKAIVPEPECAEESETCLITDDCCENLFCSEKHCCPKGETWDASQKECIAQPQLKCNPDENKFCCDAPQSYDDQGYVIEDISNDYSDFDFGSCGLASCYLAEQEFGSDSNSNFNPLCCKDDADEYYVVWGNEEEGEESKKGCCDDISDSIIGDGTYQECVNCGFKECDNRIPNPSFEFGGAKTTQWWEHAFFGAKIEKYSRTLAYDGTYVMKYTADANGQGYVFSDKFCIAPSTQYKFTIYGKLVEEGDSASGQLLVNCQDANGNPTDSFTEEIILRKQEYESKWKELSLAFSTGSKTAACRAGVSVTTPNKIVYFDSAELKELGCYGDECDLVDAYWANASLPDESVNLWPLWNDILLVVEGTEKCDGETVTFSLSEGGLEDGFEWLPLIDSTSVFDCSKGLCSTSVLWTFGYENASQICDDEGDCSGPDIECDPKCPPSCGVNCCDSKHECTDFCDMTEECNNYAQYPNCRQYCNVVFWGG